MAHLLALLVIWSFTSLINAIQVGVGKADITGPIGEIDMMGYAKLGNAANGIHLRLYARAFIFGDDKNRLVYVSCGLGQISNFVKQRVIKGLNNPLYTEENVMLSAEHTHSGPSGYLDHFLYVANVFGTVPGEREAIAEGIINAIQQAHLMLENSPLSQLEIHQGDIEGASLNRSPLAYMNNPEQERSKYKSNVDNTMTILSAKDKNGTIGSFVSWFPVHGVSMNNTFKLVSGDNKGFASHIFELESKPGFVAGFSISAAGDVSPNIKGSFCADSGLPCDGGPDSCLNKQGKSRIELCVSVGPASLNNNFENTKIIGQKQANAAKTILREGGLPIFHNSTIQYRHYWVDMSNVKVKKDNTTYQTCKPAMGASFAAGTTDGPGVDGAFQGLGVGNLGLQFLSKILKVVLAPGQILPPSSQQLIKCQYPKTVLLATGEYKFPYIWQPSILPLQIFLIGRKFSIIGFPAEITTMAGRRLKNAVRAKLIQENILDSDGVVVIAGLSNSYSSYVTTFEEYQVQRYEGGSTIFGPHTLQAFIDKFTNLAASFSPDSVIALDRAKIIKEGDYKEISLNNKIVHKVIKDAGNYGKLVQDVQKRAKIGHTVSAIFECSHPRNHGYFNPFMAVEKLTNNQWEKVLNDGQWDTKFQWFRIGGILSAKSHCLVSWSIGETIKVQPGTYRLRLFGTAQKLKTKQKYEGFSSSFVVE